MKTKDTNTEERILNAAKEVFMTYGLYGARMQDIANRAKINKALLHYYYRSKEKLFDTVFEGALEKYFEQMRVFADTSLPIQERIFKYIDNIIDFFQEYPQMSVFIIKEISINPELFHQKITHLKRETGIPLMSLLKQGIKEGELSDFDYVTFMINLHSLCAYPFIASPIFKAIIDRNNEQYIDPNNDKLKASIKDFVSHKFTFHS